MRKTCLLLVACCVAALLRAQDTTSLQFTFNHLALSVKDVNRSAAFYKQVLALKEITNRTKVEGIRWFSLGEDKELHLVSTLKEPVTINKAVHLALATPRFDVLIKQLDEQHIPYSDWPGKPQTITTRADGIRQIYIQDPDGYWIEVNDVKGK